MRKLSYLLSVLCVWIFAACSSDDNKFNDMPQINFDKANYTLASGTVDIKLVAEVPATTTISIPVSFAGEAAEETDFTVSDKAFTFQPGDTEATITLTRVEGSVGDENKSLTINAGAAPQDFKVGLMNFTTVTLLSKNGVIMSFVKDNGILNMTSNFYVALTNMSGRNYKATEKLSLDVEVDPSSTAVEGTHFEFVDNKKYASIAKNKYDGTVSLKFLKKEEGKDKLVLRLSNRSGFACGSNATMTILIEGACNLAGTWAFKEITTKDYWISSMGATKEEMANYPSGSPADQITFEGNSYTEYTFTPNLSGSLKNYFGTKAQTIKFIDEIEKNLWENASSKYDANITVSEYSFPNINEYFSATKTNNRNGVVSFRKLISDGNELLECTIDDYIPTDFLTDQWEWWIKDYGTQPPLMNDGPVRVYFTRVK